MQNPKSRGVLFDLDGTFADTAPDLAYALNEVLGSHGLPPRPFEEIRTQVSHGGRALIRLGFGLAPENEGFEEIREEFLNIYRHNICHRTRLFPGMQTLLETLEQRQIPWGIVTNKPAWLTVPLVEQMGIRSRAGCIVSGDTTPHAKPHPAPLLHACEQLSLPTPECVYVGDAQRDIEAGRNAGTATLVALFGYIGADEQPETWGANGYVTHPSEILDWLDGS